jgi:hypothetical protein
MSKKKKGNGNNRRKRNKLVRWSKNTVPTWITIGSKRISIVDRHKAELVLVEVTYITNDVSKPKLSKGFISSGRHSTPTTQIHYGNLIMHYVDTSAHPRCNTIS